VVSTVAAPVEPAVHVVVDSQGVRRVSEIVGVPGRLENDII
jgi:pilus assembly protein CpaF